MSPGENQTVYSARHPEGEVGAENPPDLRRGLATLNPRYRPYLLSIGALGALTAILSFAGNSTLFRLAGAVTMQSGDSASPQSWLDQSFQFLIVQAQHIGLAPFASVAVMFAVLVALQSELTRQGDKVSARLMIRSRNDTETAVIHNLLHQGDSFYSTHALAEIANRLSIDLQRAAFRRAYVGRICWSLVVTVGSLLFFFEQSVPVAITALLLSVLSAFIILLLSSPALPLDREYLAAEDNARARADNFLRAAPEIQAHQAHAQVLQLLARSFDARAFAFLRREGWRDRLACVKSLCLLVSILASITVAYFAAASGKTATGTAELVALMTVILWSLPRLFQETIETALLLVDIRASKASLQRIMEYQAVGAGAKPRTIGDRRLGETASGGAHLAITNATYQYPGAGGLVGGIVNADLNASEGTWTAIVGRAGCGKSTLLNLALGRYAPQAGHIRLDIPRSGQAADRDISASVAYLPQKIVLVDGTVWENLCFGNERLALDVGPSALPQSAFATIEVIGLGRIIRNKVLGERPSSAELEKSAQLLPGLQKSVRHALAAQSEGHMVAQYDPANLPPRFRLIEALLFSALDIEALVPHLLGRRLAQVLATIAATPAGQEFVRSARHVVLRNAELNQLANYDVYCDISAMPVDRLTWEHRRDMETSVSARAQIVDDVEIVRAALLSQIGEWPLVSLNPYPLLARLKQECAGECAQLGAVAGADSVSLDSAGLNRWLTWRENLLFGTPGVQNARAERQIDELLHIEIERSSGLCRQLTEQGMAVEVGNLGSRFSGGQGQLIALARALLRDPILLVLDEPTSALDPASRSAVVAHLQEIRRGRILITVTHDPEVMRSVDHVVLIDSGRIVGTGTFAELHVQSPIFGQLIHAG